MSASRPEIIRQHLAGFLEKHQVTRVYYAYPGGSPPQLAYITAFSRLSLILAGRHPMQIAGARQADRICPEEGQAVVVLPNRWNKPDWSEPGTVMTFLFGPRQIGISLTSHAGELSEPLAEATANLSRPLDTITTALIASLVDLQPTRSRETLNNRIVEALLHSLLLQLQHLEKPTLSKSQRTYEAICLFIQENAHCFMTRETVADHFDLSPSHISRLFRTEGSMRFSDYVNLVRINRAKVLLLESRATIKEIAADCGFTDNAYFCRVFQRFVKKTPTRYRLSR